jgi:alkanesulfonate monooxygenase SsuD/methylene tetrahydromethanopterin reductase-like flavin-dependent oxidoreductase (luciferase family)
MSDTLGVQLTPWCSATELLAAGRLLAPAVDKVWVQDQMLARNVYASLGAMAAVGCGVGTNVTYPIGRNPIEMASALATIAELVPAGREVSVGMGTGGAVVNSLFVKTRPVGAVKEAISLMQGLWRGDDVPLDDFPLLGSALGYRPGATARLTFPVANPPSIILAGVGPQIMKVAAAHADGLLSSSNFPTHCLAAFRSGLFRELSGIDAVLERVGERPFRLVFGINTSVSRDREAARAHARRQVALVLGNPALWPAIEAVGLDLDSAQDVKQAFDDGLGIEGAASRVAEATTDALIVSGGPEECIEGLAELAGHAGREGFTELYIGGPLGPDQIEAAGLLADIVIPAVWPERAGAAL